MEMVAWKYVALLSVRKSSLDFVTLISMDCAGNVWY